MSLPGHTFWVYALAFSPDGTKLVTSCYDHTLRIWEMPAGTLQRTIEFPSDFLTPTAFSADGTLLACVGGNDEIQFRKTGTWEVVETAVGHTDRIKSLTFSPDGKSLASASDDGTIRLWEVATGEERCVFRGHVGEVECIKFTPDGRTLVSAGQDGTVRVWRTASEEEVRTADEAYANRPDAQRAQSIVLAPTDSSPPPIPTTKADWEVVFFPWKQAAGPSGRPPESWDDVLNSPPIREQRSSSINFSWGTDSPGRGVPTDNFALVATATVELAEGKYTLTTLSDDGVRVFVDGQLKIENWTAHPPLLDKSQADLKSGKHEVRIEYFEIEGDATLQFGILPTPKR
jgi:WD40 repeat protein